MEKRMTYTVGQELWWMPIYFRWDVPDIVEVLRVYRCGSALLSNHQTVDPEGIAQWENGKVLGKVDTL
jgi:hypothetical protein